MDVERTRQYYHHHRTVRNDFTAAISFSFDTLYLTNDTDTDTDTDNNNDNNNNSDNTL